MALKTNSESVIELATLLGITRTRALALLRRCNENKQLAIETYTRELTQNLNQIQTQPINQPVNQSNNPIPDPVPEVTSSLSNGHANLSPNNQPIAEAVIQPNIQASDNQDVVSTNQSTQQSANPSPTTFGTLISPTVAAALPAQPVTASLSQPISQSHIPTSSSSLSSSQPVVASAAELYSSSQPITHPSLAVSDAGPFIKSPSPSHQPVAQSMVPSHPISTSLSTSQSSSSNLNPIVSQPSSASVDLERFIRGEDSYLSTSNSSASDAAKQFEAKRLARLAGGQSFSYAVKQEKPQVSTGLFASAERSASLFSPSSSASGSNSVKSEPRSSSFSHGTHVKSESSSLSNPISSSSSSLSSNKSRDGKLTVTITDESPNAPYPSMIVRLIPHVNFQKVYRMFETKNYVEPRLSFLGVEIQRTDVPQELDIFDGAQLELTYKIIRQLPTEPSQQPSSSAVVASSSNGAAGVKRERDDDWNASCSDKRIKVDDNDADGSSAVSPVSSTTPSIPSYEDTVPWFKTVLLGTLSISFRSMGLDKIEKKHLDWSKFEPLTYSGLLMVQPESTRQWQALSACASGKPSYFDIKIRLVTTNRVEGPAMLDYSDDDMSGDSSMDDSDDDMGMFGGRYRGRRSRGSRASRVSSMLNSLMNGVSTLAGLTGSHHFVHDLKFDVSLTAAAMGNTIYGLNELLHLTIGNKFDRLRKAAFGSMHNKHTVPDMDITSVLSLAQRKSFIAKVPPPASGSSSVIARIKRENEEEKSGSVAEASEDQTFEQRALAYLRTECESGDHDWPNEWLTSADGVLGTEDFSDMCESRLILRDYQLQSVLWMLGQELSASVAAPFWQTMIVDGEQLFYSPLLQAFRTGPLEDTRGGLLCDSMGLGKTISIMALANIHPAPAAWLANEPISQETKTRSRATIIIAPSSLVGQWVAELNKASLKSPKILCYYGSTRPTNPYVVADHDFVLTTPDVLANDMEGRRSVRGPLFSVEWWRVIVDEGHTLKDLNTKRSRACRALKSQQRFLLTGTPMSSALSNLHGLFAFLHIKAIGDWNQIWTSMDQIASGTRQRRAQDRYDAPSMYRLLELMMTQLCMRHTKDAPFNGRRDLIELPPIHMSNIKINFTPEQKAAYQELDEFARKKFDALVAADQLRAKTIVALSYLLPARQACAGGVMNMTEQRRKEELAQQQLDALQAARSRADVRSYAPAYDDSDDEGGAANNDPSNVHAYPVAKHPPFNELTDECTICLSEFSLPLQTSCNHLFCADCVLQLIAHSPGAAMCPQCRAHLSRNKLFQPLKPRAPSPPPVVPESAPGVKEEKKEEEKKEESSMIVFDAKLRVLLDHLLIDQQQSPAVKCLVFTQFSSTLQWIETALKARGIKTFKITGDMTMTRRTRILQQFNQSNEFTVFLLSIRVGAVGLTLTAASRVYLCEPCLNPSLTLQAIGRVCRLGQRNEVQIKQLVMRDSVEERIEAIVKDRLKDLHSHFSSAAARSDDSEPQLAANIGAISRDGSASLQTQQLYTLFGRTL